MHEIPERFWSLFRSVNRATYIEALLKINEEYEYSNYFLSREMCIQLLSSYFAQKRYVIWQDELEEEEDQLEPPATRVLNWLLKTGWLRKVDDYSTMTVNIVIPDYAAVMIEAFHRLSNEQEDETQIYIQNVYAILFSLKNDSRAGIGLLDTAIINTRKLNKSLQDLLHNLAVRSRFTADIQLVGCDHGHFFHLFKRLLLGGFPGQNKLGTDITGQSAGAYLIPAFRRII